MKANYWAMDRSRWLILATGYFVLLELVVHMKAGSVFALAFTWLLVHQWLLAQTGLPRPADNPAERTILAFTYGLIIAFFIFVIFAVLNALARIIDNDWTFFRLP